MEKTIENNIRTCFKVEFTGKAAALILKKQLDLSLNGAINDKNRSIVANMLMTEYANLLEQKK